MSKSSYMKRKGGNTVTKKMVANRMEDMATLMTAMEATLMEWEVWYRLIQQQKKSLTPEQFDFFLQDGPIFTEFTGKIMKSIRDQMPALEELPPEEPKASVLGADGLPVVPNQTPMLLDGSGNVIPPKV